MDGIIELYAPEYLERKRKRNRLLGRMLILLALAGLGVCVALCIGVNTENSYRRMLWTIITSTVTGWIVIYIYVFGYRAAKREIAHGEHLQGEERKLLSGPVTFSPKARRIRSSIRVRDVFVQTPEGERTALINAARVKELERAGNPLRLWTAHGYVTAYEVNHEIS